MKMIVLVAVLAAAGCSKKRSDCDAAIAKAMDNFAASTRTDAPNPQVQETRLTVIGKLRGTLTKRCTEDKWPAEVVSCFTTVVAMKDIQACQAKLNEAQRTRLLTEIRQVMMGSMGPRMMPSGMAGHPPMLAGSGAPGGAAVPAGSAAASAAGSAASTTSGSAAAPAAGSAAAPAAGSAVAPAAGAGAK